MGETEERSLINATDGQTVGRIVYSRILTE